MNLYVVQFFSVLFLFNSVLSQNHTVKNLTDTESTFSWGPTDSPSIQVSVDDGYQIQVDVTHLDINGENGDSITITSATEDEEENSNLLVFSYTVSGKPSYLYNTNKINANYYSDNKSNNFSIKFTRVGEIATTTPEPSSTTTTPAMPTASPEESASLTVYIQRKAAANVTEEIKNLTISIAQMGQKYCDDQNCPLNESITINNVKINTLKPCPVIWENYDSCMNLTFALPIVKIGNVTTDTLWDGYQLSEANLRLMWQNYAQQVLEEHNLQLYSKPDVKAIFTVRLIVIGSVIVVLVILIVILKRYVSQLTRRRRKSSDTFTIIDNQSSKRTSQLSLTPHYLQELPPLFSNDFPLHPDQRNHNKLFISGFTNDSSTSGTGNLVNLSNTEDGDGLFEDTHA